MCDGVTQCDELLVCSLGCLWTGMIKTMSALRIEFNPVVSEEDEIRAIRLSSHNLLHNLLQIIIA